MKISVSPKLNKKVDLLVVPTFQGKDHLQSVPTELKTITAALRKDKSFKSEAGQHHHVTPLSEKLPKNILFLGMGKMMDFQSADGRNMAADAIKFAKKLESDLTLVVPEAANDFFQEIAEGLELANYNPAKYQTGESKKKHDKADVKTTTLITAKKPSAAIKRGQNIADAVMNARDLINAPHNLMNGTMLMNAAKKIGKANKFKVSVMTKKQIEKLKMGAFLGVNKGSDTDANMVILEHKPKGATGKPIVLVGKGITFDSGGYNLKSGAWFADMKMDMSGAAVVMNVLGLCGKLGIKKHVIGITPITDNLIGPKAQKVADIVTSYSGKTIEVNNTDAEGRLILADAMAYAVEKFKPAQMIDVATLTGACIIKKKKKYAGLFANNDRMIEGLKKASEATDELVWHLPLHPDHTKEMKSRIADLQNVNYGNKGMAGASTAAAFLQEFVGKTDWAHLDIAGTAFVSKPKKYEAPMGTGYGVRLLTNYLETL